MRLDNGGVTLLTGSNGTGKSTILRTIAWAADGSWLQLAEVQFDRLEFSFSDTSVLTVERVDDALRIAHDEREFLFEPSSISPIDPNELSFARARGILRLGAQRYRFEGREYTRGELSLVLGMRSMLEEQDALWVAEIPNWFRVRYVTDQRLVLQPRAAPAPVSREPRALPTRMAVEEYADSLASEIRRNLADFFAHSQGYDQTFPERVVDAMLDPEHPMSRGEVAELLDRVNTERLALGRVGLLDTAMGPVGFDDRHLDDERVRQVVGTFARDTLTKFKTLATFQLRLERLVEFVNEHFDRKHLVVDREHGFRILLDNTDRFLRPSDLSSGEQHMLVLAYRILFWASRGILLLIDEPELSLHVVWQARLVDDLRKMGEVNDLSFILATHSPSLVGPHEELVRSLD
jgi:predicted ATPase